MAFTYGSVTNCQVVKGTTRTEYECRLGYQLNYQSKENNTSNITLQLEVRSISSNYGTYGYYQTSTIDGTSLGSSKFDMRNTNTWQVFGTRTFNVSHGSDGKYSATKSGSFTTTCTSSNGGDYALKSGSASVWFSLPDIPRESSISVSGSSFNIGDKITITTTKNSSSFVDKIKMSFGETKTSSQYVRYITENAVSPTVWDTSIDADEIYKKIPSASRGVCQLTVETYNGSTLIGSNTISFLLLVGEANPIFPDFEFSDINPQTVRLLEGEDAITSQSIILGYSNVQVTIPVETKAIAQKGATILNYRFNNKQKNYSDTEDVVMEPVVATSGDFTVYATDSRQNSTPKTKGAIRIVEYTPLVKNEITAKRQNGTSEATILSFSGKIDLENFGAVTNSIKTSKYIYSIAGKEDWSEEFNINLTVDANGNFSFNELIIGDIENVGFDIENAYDIKVIIEDELSKAEFSTTLSSGTPHVAYSKNGICFMGKYDDEVGGKAQVNGNPLAYYPIGSIYISVNETNPKDLFGGTWERIKDRFLLSAGDTYSNGSTGGSAELQAHTHNIPSLSGTATWAGTHNHLVSNRSSTYGSGQQSGWRCITSPHSENGDYWQDNYTNDAGSHQHSVTTNASTTGSTGNGSQGNMPPYLAVYMWKRIA